MKSPTDWWRNLQLTLLRSGSAGGGLVAPRFGGACALRRHPNYWRLRWRFMEISAAQTGQLYCRALAPHSHSFKSP